MPRFALLLLVVAALLVAACAAPARPASYGAARPTVQSAMDTSSPAGNPVEIIGVNVPIGNPLDPWGALKAGFIWYGQTVDVTVPAPFDAQAAACGQGVYMVPQTRMVEERRVVPQTTMTPHVLVPLETVQPTSRAAGCP